MGASGAQASPRSDPALPTALPSPGWTWSAQTAGLPLVSGAEDLLPESQLGCRSPCTEGLADVRPWQAPSPQWPQHRDGGPSTEGQGVLPTGWDGVHGLWAWGAG